MTSGGIWEIAVSRIRRRISGKFFNITNVSLFGFCLLVFLSDFQEAVKNVLREI